MSLSAGTRYLPTWLRCQCAWHASLEVPSSWGWLQKRESWEERVGRNEAVVNTSINTWLGGGRRGTF